MIAWSIADTPPLSIVPQAVGWISTKGGVIASCGRPDHLPCVALQGANRLCNTQYPAPCLRQLQSQLRFPRLEYAVFERLHERPQVLDEVLRMDVAARCAGQL